MQEWLEGIDWHPFDFIPFANLLLSLGSGNSKNKFWLMVAWSFIFPFVGIGLYKLAVNIIGLL